MTTYETLSEYIRSDASPNAPYVHECHVTGSMDIDLVGVSNNPAGHYPDPPLADYMLILQTKGAMQTQVDLGVRPIRAPMRTGTILLAPPDTATDYQVDGPFDLALVSLPKTLFNTAQDAIGAGAKLDLEYLHGDFFQDPLLQQLVLRMFREAREDNAKGALFVDHAVYTIAATLLGLAGRLKARYRAASPMSDTQLAQIRALIDDRIDEKITLDEMAALIGWDVYRFSRAFRNTVGQPPHQYVLSRRLELARQQLTTTKDTLAEVAYSVGFSSQQHMTNLFRKHVGTTPARYRAEVAA